MIHVYSSVSIDKHPEFHCLVVSSKSKKDAAMYLNRKLKKHCRKPFKALDESDLFLVPQAKGGFFMLVSR